MKIEDDPDYHQELINNIIKFYGFDAVRDGIHMSDLTQCITMSFWNKIGKIDPDPDSILFWLVGIGLEKALVTGKPKVIPKATDGIYSSPDISINRNLGEIKTTRMGLVKGEPKFGWPQEWIRRIMGYCYTYGVLEYRLGTLFIIPAKLVAKRFTFTKDELIHFWDTYIIPRRDALVEALEQQKAPEPFKYNESYECKNCQYLTMCEGITIAGNFVPANLDTVSENIMLGDD